MRLRNNGWTVFRFWEHESPIEAAEAITSAVSALMAK